MSDVPKAASILCFTLLVVRLRLEMWITWLLCINGLLCHLTQHPRAVGWDVVVNAAVVVCMNASSDWQPGTAVCTGIGLLAFARSVTHAHESWTHIVGVHAPFILALCMWRHTRRVAGADDDLRPGVTLARAPAARKAAEVTMLRTALRAMPREETCTDDRPYHSLSP